MSPSVNEDRTMYTAGWVSLYGGYCGLGGSKCVWYGTVITATGHIRGCGAYGDRHDTLPPGIEVYQ